MPKEALFFDKNNAYLPRLQTFSVDLTTRELNLDTFFFLYLWIVGSLILINEQLQLYIIKLVPDTLNHKPCGRHNDFYDVMEKSCSLLRNTFWATIYSCPDCVGGLERTKSDELISNEAEAAFIIPSARRRRLEIIL